MVSNPSTIDTSSWDGTLSSRDFCLAARAFSDIWKTSNPAMPQWSWVVPSPKLPLIAPHQEDHDEGSHTQKEEPSCSDQDEPIDSAILVKSCGGELHHYDFHIVYSTSYRVPVLYFRAYCSDGQPLVLDDFEKDLPANSVKAITESKWTFITQEEHPYLNRPWYTLHPCGTSEWIKLLLTAEASMAKGACAIEKYLVSWFSVVGQVIGLRLPFEMLSDNAQL
ncbi:ubiquitin-like-conjugating enzyme ATG10 isoform X2 [Cornus florida]|uniref:ubiquitin-like-conjugating enzyme ATG10 isoform X2 n=1 Tax=Cornus florida TaxID=4283 RepID=UPI00289C7CE8|nr:ubiquitin-like-conjugating enzyme ATG10 isoform X2 [Cornus florida]